MPGGLPGPGGERTRATPSAISILSSRFHSFSFTSAHFLIFHMLNIFKCSLPDTTQINHMPCSLVNAEESYEYIHCFSIFVAQKFLSGSQSIALQVPRVRRARRRARADYPIL